MGGNRRTCWLERCTRRLALAFAPPLCPDRRGDVYAPVHAGVLDDGDRATLRRSVACRRRNRSTLAKMSLLDGTDRDVSRMRKAAGRQVAAAPGTSDLNLILLRPIARAGSQPSDEYQEQVVGLHPVLGAALAVGHVDGSRLRDPRRRFEDNNQIRMPPADHWRDVRAFSHRVLRPLDAMLLRSWRVPWPRSVVLVPCDRHHVRGDQAQVPGVHKADFLDHGGR